MFGFSVFQSDVLFEDESLRTKLIVVEHIPEGPVTLLTGTASIGERSPHPELSGSVPLGFRSDDHAPVTAGMFTHATHAFFDLGIFFLADGLIFKFLEKLRGFLETS